eukprot:1762369-Amphidinium_carterae.2
MQYVIERIPARWQQPPASPRLVHHHGLEALPQHVPAFDRGDLLELLRGRFRALAGPADVYDDPLDDVGLGGYNVVEGGARRSYGIHGQCNPSTTQAIVPSLSGGAPPNAAQLKGDPEALYSPNASLAPHCPFACSLHIASHARISTTYWTCGKQWPTFSLKRTQTSWTSPAASSPIGLWPCTPHQRSTSCQQRRSPSEWGTP